MGANRAISHGHHWQDAQTAIKNGAVCIVVDPRRSPTAEDAHIWVQIRPGTDDAFLLGLLHVVINEGLYDRDFVEKWCFGFDKLRERVQEYPPARVGSICDIDPDNVTKIARIFAQAESACVVIGNGINQQHNATQVHRAIAILQAITGNLDVPGGMLLPGHAQHSENIKGLKGFRGNESILFNKNFRLPEAVERQALGARQFPLWTGPDALITAVIHNPTMLNALLYGGADYPIKGFYITGINPLSTYPGAKKLHTGLMNLDSLVVASFYMTPTTELADVVLPKAHPYETEEVFVDIYGHCLTIGRKLFNPPGEAKGDIEIGNMICDRAVEKGYIERNLIPWRSMDEYNAWRLEKTGYTVDDLRKSNGYIPFPVSYKEYEQRGKFFTPTGKVELYSTLLEQYGYEPLPYHKEPPEREYTNPELVKRYPLLLSSCRTKEYHHSRFRETIWARRSRPYPVLEIHPETAAARGIENGHWVWIETPNCIGRIQMVARITPIVHPKFVNGEMGWWYPEKPAPDHGVFDSNLNAVMLYDPPHEPVFGCSTLKGVPCEIGPSDNPPVTGDPVENLKKAWQEYYLKLPGIVGTESFDPSDGSSSSEGG